MVCMLWAGASSTTVLQGAGQGLSELHVLNLRAGRLNQQDVIYTNLWTTDQKN